MPSVCVFCGSLNSVSDLYLAAARETGRLFAEAGWTIVYGGARNGMMGAFASAALAAGGRVAGVIPRNPWWTAKSPTPGWPNCASSPRYRSARP